MWGESTRRDPIVVASPGVVLLWALACETDDRGATFTGDRVCRACSGRGEVIAAWFPAGCYPGCDRWLVAGLDIGLVSRLVRSCFEDNPLPTELTITIGGSDRFSDPAIITASCACDGPTRPDTVSLAWLVAHLATQRSPLVNDWPDQWRVNRDQERARGDDSWQAQWWLAFELWVSAGIEPDADVLAGLLSPDRDVVHLPGTIKAIKVNTIFQLRPRDPATAEFLTLELRTDGYNPQWSESGHTTISGDPGHALIELGAYDCGRAILTGTVRGFGELTVSVWANGVQVATHTRRMSGTREEAIVLVADLDPGWQNLEVRAEAWMPDAIVHGGTDAEVAQAILDRERIDSEVVTPAEVRAQRFLPAPRPWLDIDVGTGRVYVDQITIDRGDQFDSHTRYDGITFITPLAIPRETTIEITMSSVDVLDGDGRAAHEAQIRAFAACREAHTMLAMWVGGESGSTALTNVWVDDVTTDHRYEPEGRLRSTFRCRTMDEPLVIV